MPASGRARIVPALFIALTCSACYVGTHYHGWHYRGGRFTNHGLLTRPRYVAQFPEISIDLRGSHTYHTNCLRLDLWACGPCRLQIWIGPVDATTLSLRVIPALQGGGWELP